MRELSDKEVLDVAGAGSSLSNWGNAEFAAGSAAAIVGAEPIAAALYTGAAICYIGAALGL